VKMQPIVMASPGWRDRLLALEQDIRHSCTLQTRGHGQTSRSGAYDHYVRIDRSSGQAGGDPLRAGHVRVFSIGHAQLSRPRFQ
jgi:hypothetical protein